MDVCETIAAQNYRGSVGECLNLGYLRWECRTWLLPSPNLGTLNPTAPPSSLSKVNHSDRYQASLLVWPCKSSYLNPQPKVMNTRHLPIPLSWPFGHSHINLVLETPVIPRNINTPFNPLLNWISFSKLFPGFSFLPAHVFLTKILPAFTRDKLNFPLPVQSGVRQTMGEKQTHGDTCLYKNWLKCVSCPGIHSIILQFTYIFFPFYHQNLSVTF